MAVYHSQQISEVDGPSAPNLLQLAGGRLARRKAIPPIIRAQDRIPAVGRRIVACQSLNGEIEWLTPDTDPTLGSSTHPNSTTYRIVGRYRTDITPGHFLRLSILCVPSGMTQIAGDNVGAGVFGTLRVSTTWYNQAAGTVSTTHDATLPASAAQFGGSPANPWGAIHLRQIDLVAPPDIIDADDMATWSRHIGALITVSHLGGVRVIDMCLSETPYWVGRESDDAADLWTSHIGGLPTPDGALLNMDEAWQRWSETSPDGRPQGGTWHMLDVAHAQGLRLGPALINWTAYNESDVSPSGNDVHDANIFSTTSNTFVGLTDATLTAYDEDSAGWTIASPAYSADYEENHDYWSGGHSALAGASIPVLVATYAGRAAGGAAGILRVQSSASSWVDVTLSGTEGWQYAYGHIETGIGPGDETTVQAFVRRTDVSGNVDVSALCVYRMGQYTPTV